MDFELAIAAGKTASEMSKNTQGCDLADAIVLCTARNLKGKVVTGDEHFKGLKEVVFMK